LAAVGAGWTLRRSAAAGPCAAPACLCSAPCPLTTPARAHSHAKCWSEGAAQLTWNTRCCSRAADHALGRLPPLAAGGQAQPRHAPCSAHASPYSQHCAPQRAAQAVGSARSLAQPLGYQQLQARERKANHLPGSAESLHQHVHKHSCVSDASPHSESGSVDDRLQTRGREVLERLCGRLPGCEGPALGLESPQRSRTCPGCRRAEPELVPVLSVAASLSLCLRSPRLLSMQSPAARLPLRHPAGEPALHSGARDSASAPAGAQVRRTGLQHRVARCRNSARCYHCLSVCRAPTLRRGRCRKPLATVPLLQQCLQRCTVLTGRQFWVSSAPALVAVLARVCSLQSCCKLHKRPPRRAGTRSSTRRSSRRPRRARPCMCCSPARALRMLARSRSSAAAAWQPRALRHRSVRQAPSYLPVISS